MEENPLEKDFKELQKATKRVFTRYDESKEEDRERAKKLLENLKSEKGNEVLIKCIKACKENSLRLRSDSQKLDGPTKSALLELAMEESSKAYYLCAIYIYLFDTKKLPIWAHKESIRGMRVTTVANTLVDIFRGHKLKGALSLIGRYAPSEYPEKFEELVIRAAKEKGKDTRQAVLKAREYIESIKNYKSIDFEKTKENGFYVDLDINTLDLFTPHSAKENELNEMEYLIKISNANVDDFLRVVEVGVAGI